MVAHPKVFDDHAGSTRQRAPRHGRVALHLVIRRCHRQSRDPLPRPSIAAILSPSAEKTMLFFSYIRHKDFPYLLGVC